MGNAQSNRNPSSVSQCFDPQTHTFSFESYFKHRRKRETEKEEDDAFYESSLELLTQSLQKPIPYKGKRKRRTKRDRNIKMYRCPIDNKLKVVPVTDTRWYQVYVASPEPDCDRFLRKFRKRFRMSYQSFLRHVHEARQCNLFKPWSEGSRDAAGNASTPLEILILGALRYLGRAVTYDDLEEHTGVSEETHRRFLLEYSKIINQINHTLPRLSLGIQVRTYSNVNYR